MQIKAISLLTLFLCCGSSTENEVRSNINIFSKQQINDILSINIPPHIPVIPAKNIYPSCGTVSHHLLVSPLINAWFRELKNLRDIKTFIIISPNHYRTGAGNISLSLLNWNTAGTITKINRDIVIKLRDMLNIKEDNSAFYNEHGIEALLPFINHYYPDADIVPILVDEKKRDGDLSFRLSEAINGIINKNKNIFLIISADFSHKCGREKTDMNDIRSKKSLLSLSLNLRPYSDNTTGLMILYRTCRSLKISNTHIYCHTDAEKYTLISQNKDITSYFFTFQY